MRTLPPELISQILRDVLLVPNCSAELGFRCVLGYTDLDIHLERHKRCLLTCSIWYTLGMPYLLETVYSENGDLTSLQATIHRQPHLALSVRRVFVVFHQHSYEKGLNWLKSMPEEGCESIHTIGFLFSKADTWAVEAGLRFAETFRAVYNLKPQVAFFDSDDWPLVTTPDLIQQSGPQLRALYVPIYERHFFARGAPSIRIAELHLMADGGYVAVIARLARSGNFRGIWLHARGTQSGHESRRHQLQALVDQLVADGVKTAVHYVSEDDT